MPRNDGLPALIPEAVNALDKVAQAAFHKFEAGKPRWHETMQELFKELARHAELPPMPGEERIRIEGNAIAGVFGLLADMFANTGRGARHELASVAPLHNRPPRHTSELSANIAIAILVGIETMRMKQRGKKVDDAYRAVATALRSKGQVITWNRCRSVWKNRKHFGADANAQIDEAIDAFREDPSDLHYVKLVWDAEGCLRAEGWFKPAE